MPGGFPIVRFVAAPDVGAEVLYECNVSLEQKYVGHDGFDAGAPTWSGEPRTSGGLEGYRTLTFNHYVSADPGTAAVALRDLARILLADDSWILVQMTAESPPVWFRTWRSTPGSLSLERVMLAAGGIASGKYAIPLSLSADPYAVGELRVLASGTIANDPAAATNPNALLLAAPVGDAPAPAIIDVTYSRNPIASTTLIQTTAVEDTYVKPVVIPFGTGDSWTGAGAGGTTADSDASGGSARTGDLSSTVGVTVTLSNAFATPIPAGDYLVFLRQGANAANVAFGARLAVGVPDAVIPADTFWTTTLLYRWTFLALVSLPFGAIVPDTVREAAPSATAAFNLYLTRLIGTSDPRLDAMVLIPADSTSRSLYVEHTDIPAGAWLERIDGDDELVYHQAGDGTIAPAKIGVAGSFPRLIPGRPNALHVIGGTALGVGAGGTGADVLTDTFAVTVSYRPRYLWMQP